MLAIRVRIHNYEYTSPELAHLRHKTTEGILGISLTAEFQLSALRAEQCDGGLQRSRSAKGIYVPVLEDVSSMTISSQGWTSRVPTSVSTVPTSVRHCGNHQIREHHFHCQQTCLRLFAGRNTHLTLRRSCAALRPQQSACSNWVHGRHGTGH